MFVMTDLTNFWRRGRTVSIYTRWREEETCAAASSNLGYFDGIFAMIIRSKFSRGNKQNGHGDGAIKCSNYLTNHLGFYCTCYVYIQIVNQVGKIKYQNIQKYLNRLREAFNKKKHFLIDIRQ